MGIRGVARAVVAIAASMVLLAGCAEARQVPASGVSAAEFARYNEYIGSLVWEFTGLPESVRPKVTAQVVDAEQWSELLGACGDMADVAAGEQAAIINEYTCRMSYQLSAQDLGLLNEAQLDYLYDYYQDTLIPCLQLHGVEVRSAPSRAEAVDIGRYGAYPWNPYSDLADFTTDDPDDMSTGQECPAFPPDPVFDRYRQW